MSEDKRVIVLTSDVALTITHQEWPVQVVALDYSGVGEFALRVREHRDGQVIVYGTHGSHITGEHYAAAGELLASDANATESIFRVGIQLRAPPGLVRNAIAQLTQNLTAA